jgi:hypothetical protein
MITCAKYIAAIAVALAVISSPSFAGSHMSKARAAALRECNAKAEVYSNAAWQMEQLAVYRACMFAHGQVE